MTFTDKQQVICNFFIAHAHIGAGSENKKRGKRITKRDKKITNWGRDYRWVQNNSHRSYKFNQGFLGVLFTFMFSEMT